MLMGTPVGLKAPEAEAPPPHTLASYTTVRIPMRVKKLISVLQNRIELRVHGGLPESVQQSVKKGGKIGVGVVIEAALAALKAQMDAEDGVLPEGGSQDSE